MASGSGNQQYDVAIILSQASSKITLSVTHTHRLQKHDDIQDRCYQPTGMKSTDWHLRAGGISGSQMLLQNLKFRMTKQSAPCLNFMHSLLCCMRRLRVGQHPVACHGWAWFDLHLGWPQHRQDRNHLSCLMQHPEDAPRDRAARGCRRAVERMHVKVKEKTYHSTEPLTQINFA